MNPVEGNSISEKELVDRCLADERVYQEILYRKYSDKMYRVALTYSTNDDEACDILQEGFINVFRNLHRFRFDCPLEGWIRRIIVNKALELYRQKQRREEVMEVYSREAHSLPEEILSKISADEIIQLVNDLPLKATMVLKLFAIEGYSHTEIAEIMEISVGTSKSQLNRARAILKDKLSLNYG